MFFQCLLDESIDSRIKVCSTGKFVCHAFQNISNNGVQYGVCTGDGHGRSHHTEFEFVSCESKWWCTVTVSSILLNRRNRTYTDIHFLAFNTVSSRTGSDNLLYDILKLFAKENRDDCRRCLVCTKTVVISRVGCRHTKQGSIFINRFNDGR